MVTRIKAAIRERLVSWGYFVDADYWAIAMYEGGSPLHLRPLAGPARPVLGARDVGDIDAAFVADPFMVRTDDGWHMFFEAMNCANDRGEIALATSDDGRRWTYRQIVLAAPYHLSYPFVFQWQGEHFLVPETRATARVELYRAQRFPDVWELTDVLLSGSQFKDTTLFRHGDRWWMMSETSDGIEFDTLRLYSSETLQEPWREHPQSPVVVGDASSARPAGRVISDGGRLLRFAQDCTSVYGRNVRAFEITQLTPEAYEERPARDQPVLRPPRYGWNDYGVHHVDAHEVVPGRWLACVDGRPTPGLRRPPRIVAVQRPRTHHDRAPIKEAVRRT